MPASDKPRVIDTNDVLEILEDAREPFLSTGEVTERLPASKPTVRDRLQSLEEEGLVRYRVLGANTPAWYLPELENRRLPEYINGETPDDDGDSPDSEDGEAGAIGETQTAPVYDEGSVTLSQMSLGLILFVPILLAVDAVGTALLASGLGGGYAVLWAIGYDGRFAHHLTRAKREYDAVGGLVGFVRCSFGLDDVQDPNTLVERAARLDAYAFSLVIVSAVFSSPVWASYWLGTAGFGTWDPFIEFLGAGTVLSIIVITMLGTMLALVLSGVSAIASLALASAGVGEAYNDAWSRLGL